MFRSLVADEPLRVGNFVLIPVAEVYSFSMVRDERAAFAGTKRVKAVVALGPGGPVALNVSGEELLLLDLLDQVSGLNELLAAFSSENGRGGEEIDKVDRKRGGA
ncbi:MAG TPA: hypothetical protein PLZ42_05255 [Methanothrix sp.]|nr:hypothetical protein [Methanothrix sp.]